MMDIFDWYRDQYRRYPDEPGFQGGDTSRKAAEDIKPRAPTIQQKVLIALEDRPMASFELAKAISVSYRSVQPRTSELAAQGKIADSGARRRDPETGKEVIVWRIA